MAEKPRSRVIVRRQASQAAAIRRWPRRFVSPALDAAAILAAISLHSIDAGGDFSHGIDDTFSVEAHMARWARLVAPQYPMHVTHRGHNRETTFHDESDFATYREILLQASVRASCAIHAYALMSNHIHLLLTPSDPLGAARLMQRVGSRFVRYWNKRHRRSGTMWDGRFRSSIVANDGYFLACSRYIDLNPVRAGLVHAAESYEWSSYRHLAHGAPDALIKSHVAYDALAGTVELRRTAYREYCSQGTPTRAAQAIRSATRSGAATGNLRFIARVESLLRRPATRLGHGGDRRSDGWQNLTY